MLPASRPARRCDRLRPPPKDTHDPPETRPGPVKHRLLLNLLLAPTLAFVLWLWWRDGQPRPVVDAPGGQLDCISYSPAIRSGVLGATIDRSVLVHDLTLLAERFRCVRIYTISEGLGEVPAIARDLKLKVLLGLWIGRNSLQNQREINEGLKLAAEYHDVVEAVVVGNEVLLRKELSAGRLAELIAQVDEGTDLPVTYADVWDFWRENPGLAPLVSFVTIHLLPYWEDQPSGIDAALKHIAEVHSEAHATFPDKPIYIGESGWPSRGRQREDAAPSLVNQARFVREFTSWAHDSGIKYNLIEAFDQPWKRNQEGTVGGYWGIYDSLGRPKFGLTGPVTEDPLWQRGFVGAGVGGALFLLLGLLSARRRTLASALCLLLAGAVAGAVALLQWRYAVAANRTTTEWVTSGVLAALGWAIYLRVVAAVTRDQGTLPVPAGLAELLGNLGGNLTRLKGRERGLGLLRFGLLLALAYHVLGLAFDPRYRDFPLAVFSLPACALAVLALFTSRERVTSLRLTAEEGLLAGVIAACAIASAIIEGPKNVPALAFVALSGAAAFSVFWTARGFAGEHQPGEQHADHG
jgi:exo-beta-1,3-glucanase (GH17 family)